MTLKFKCAAEKADFYNKNVVGISNSNLNEFVYILPAFLVSLTHTHGVACILKKSLRKSD